MRPRKDTTKKTKSVKIPPSNRSEYLLHEASIYWNLFEANDINSVIVHKILGFVSNSQQYASPAFKETSMYNQFIDLSSLSKAGSHKTARWKKMDILKLKRLNRKNKSSGNICIHSYYWKTDFNWIVFNDFFITVLVAELLTKPEDIVILLASDSESDNDDDMDINVTATVTKQKNKQTPNITKDALFSAIGLTDTG